MKGGCGGGRLVWEVGSEGRLWGGGRLVWEVGSEGRLWGGGGWCGR